MAITKIESVRPAELPGKYICAPAVFLDLSYGWPARITHATAKQLHYVPLPRGEWNATDKEWTVGSEREGPGVDTARRCNHDSVKVVCDTAAEVIALYNQAMTLMKAIQQFRKSQQALLDAFIAAHAPGTTTKG